MAANGLENLRGPELVRLAHLLDLFGRHVGFVFVLTLTLFGEDDSRVSLIGEFAQIAQAIVQVVGHHGHVVEEESGASGAPENVHHEPA